MATYQIGDQVVKPGLGICKIKAIRKLQVEGKEQQFYVLQSGDVSVMVPCTKGKTASIRPLLDKGGMQKILEFLRDPIVIPPEEEETLEFYKVENVEAAKDKIKHRDPKSSAQLLKNLFYKEKLAPLDKTEANLFQEALVLLAEEYAHIYHTTRQKAMHQMRSCLKEGRKARKENMF